MSKNVKKIIFTNKLKNLGSRFRWHLFSEFQDYKLTSDYIDFICPEPENNKVNSIEKLENIVKESLIKEFSPEIQNTRYFNLLVDAVVHRLQKSSVND